MPTSPSAFAKGRVYVLDGIPDARYELIEVYQVQFPHNGGEWSSRPRGKFKPLHRHAWSFMEFLDVAGRYLTPEGAQCGASSARATAIEKEIKA